MKRSPSLLVLAAVAVACLLTGCSADEVDVAGVRDAAEAAGDDPDECPLDLDVEGALDDVGVDGDVVAGAVDVEVSEETTPADDPLAAQTEDGASALEAIAGTYVSCSYDVGDAALDVRVVATPADAPAGAITLVPQLTADADVALSDVQGITEDLVDAGEAVLAPGGTAAIVSIEGDGSGSAGLLVSGDAVEGDDLTDVAESLAGDLADQG